ncbi:MAG: PmoA family protein [Armatimonadota bacterium]|nr:PmoA family protein [bacterium]MDW8321524.1 PmoA family protein [Armatimonadota bacterium]
MRYALFASCLALCIACATAPAAQATFRLSVKTEGEAPTLVVVNLPATVKTDVVRLLLLPEGTEVPCDLRLMEKGLRQLLWIHPGGKREYLVETDRASSAPTRWQSQLKANVLEISCDGKLVTRYVYSGFAKPYLYPIHAQTGVPMTRAYPMEQREGESADHPHQKSFWFTHGDVNGVDFWTEGGGKGSIVHREFSDISGGRVGSFITTRNEWRTPQGQVLCTDTREVCVYDMGDLRIIDFTVTVRAGDQPLRFGDTKEGTFGIRIPSSMELRRGKGNILTAEGKRDKDAWGTRAVWCTYSGDNGGEVYSISVFDHPANPHHPTHWHVRDYGLFSANPFGWRDFQNNPNVDGSITVPAGGQVTFRYRVIFAKGAIPAERLNALYAAFAKGVKVDRVP